MSQASHTIMAKVPELPQSSERAPIKIAIWFEDEQKFDLVPFMFFVSSANAAQKSFQFYFPDPPDSLKYDIAVERHDKSQSIFIDGAGGTVLYEAYVFITAAHMDGNIFFEEYGPLVHITTFGWEEYFSPPSVFEYLFHSMLCGMLYALTDVEHHLYCTMGCQFEYTRVKELDRIDIALGYICDEHRQVICDSLGTYALADIELLFKFAWLGKPDEHGTIAYKMMELFKCDLRKDSGYKKKFLERVQTSIDVIWFDMAKEIFKALVLIIVAFLLFKFGLKP